jgi:hypothetical protein
MTGILTRDPATREVTTPSAVCWIDGAEAIVALMSRDGRISTCEMNRGWLPEAAYLAQVVKVIGDRDRVTILGPSSMRLLLEREYVAVFHRPHRLVDVEPEGPIVRAELVERVRALAA